MNQIILFLAIRFRYSQKLFDLAEVTTNDSLPPFVIAPWAGTGQGKHQQNTSWHDQCSHIFKLIACNIDLWLIIWLKFGTRAWHYVIKANLIVNMHNYKSPAVFVQLPTYCYNYYMRTFHYFRHLICHKEVTCAL